jgi:hypothetical protein
MVLGPFENVTNHVLNPLVLNTELVFVSTDAALWLEKQGYKHGNKSKQVSLMSLEGSFRCGACQCGSKCYPT